MILLQIITAKSKPKSKLKQLCSWEVLKGSAESRLEARFVKTELDTSSLLMNEGVIIQTVERTNKQMRKVKKN